MSENVDQKVTEAVVEAVVANVEGTWTDVMFLIIFAVAQVLLIEGIGYYYVFRKDEYHETQDKTRNLSKRIKKLRHDYLYVPSTKKKQE